MVSEINKGFYGLGPLNQAAMQDLLSVLSLRFRLSQLPLLWWRFKFLDLAVSQKNVRGMESYHRLAASSVLLKQNFFSFKNKHILSSLLCLECWFSPVGSCCTTSLLEDHKTQKELLGRWPQSSQHNTKCHSFPQAGILEKSSRLSETKAVVPKWMSDAFAAVPAPLRHLAAAIQGLHIPGGEPSNTGEEEQTPMKGVTFLRLLKDKKGRSFNDLSRWEPPAILFFSKKVCTYLNSTYPSPDDAEELQIWMYYSLVTQETTIHWSSSNKHYEHKSILRKQLLSPPREI